MRTRIVVLSTLIIVVAFIACQSAELTSAKVYVQQSNYTAALEQLNIAAEKEPMNPQVFIMMGKIYAEMDSFAQMTEAFDRALEIDSTGIREINAWRVDKRADVFRKGQRAGENQRWDEAIQNTKTAVMIDPNFADGWFNLGYFYQKIDDNENAREAFYKAYELNPKNTLLAKQAAVFKFNEGKIDEAIAILEELVNSGDPDLETYTLLANLYIAKDDGAKADEMLDKAEALDPNNSELLFERGVARFNQKDYEGAIKYFNRIIEKDPTNRDAHYNLSLSQYNAEKFNEAAETAEKLVKNNPQDIPGWEQFARSLISAGETEKGKDAYIVSEVVATMQGRGNKTTYEVGTSEGDTTTVSVAAVEPVDYKEAVNTLKPVTARNPNWCAAWSLLMVSCNETGDSECVTKAQEGLNNCSN